MFLKVHICIPQSQRMEHLEWHMHRGRFLLYNLTHGFRDVAHCIMQNKCTHTHLNMSHSNTWLNPQLPESRRNKATTGTMTDGFSIGQFYDIIEAQL